VKTISDVVVRHSLAMDRYIYVEMICEGRPIVHENFAEAHTPRCKTPIFTLFSFGAPQP